MNKDRFKQKLVILGIITLFTILFTGEASAYHYYGANHYAEYKASYGTSVGSSYYGGYGGSGAYPYHTSYYSHGYTPLASIGYYSYKDPYYTTSYYPTVGYKIYAPVYVVSEQVPHYYKYTQPVIVSDYTSYPTYTTSVVHTTSVSTNPKPDIGVPTRTTYFHNQYLTPPGFVYVVY